MGSREGGGRVQGVCGGQSELRDKERAREASLGAAMPCRVVGNTFHYLLYLQLNAMEQEGDKWCKGCVKMVLLFYVWAFIYF